jgi:hypothetical protein
MDESDSSVYRLLGHITGPQMYRECISNTINASESVIIIAKEWREKETSRLRTSGEADGRNGLDGLSPPNGPVTEHKFRKATMPDAVLLS